MREGLQKICNSYINNRENIKEAFKWENQFMISVCAIDMCTVESDITSAHMQNCNKIINDNTGVFSNYRGNIKLPLVTLLAKSEDSVARMKKIKDIHEVLKLEFHNSEYLTLVSSILADMIEVKDAAKYATRGKQIYIRMKKEHPFLTSSEDSVFAVLMAFSEKTDDMLIKDMEECYMILKKRFSGTNIIQTMSHILVFIDEEPSVKCEKVFNLFDMLTSAGLKYSKYYELSVLAAMVIHGCDLAIAVNEIAEVDEFLSKQKGYGIFGIDKKTRLMHAVMLVSNSYAKNDAMNTVAVTSTIAMIAAQQAALCAIIASTAVSTSAAN